MTDIESRSNGSWRIFSKLGAGYSNSRSKGEIVTSAYACLPNSRSDGEVPISDWGVEMSISVRGSVTADSSLTIVEQKVAKAVQQIVQAVMDGKVT